MCETKKCSNTLAKLLCTEITHHHQPRMSHDPLKLEQSRSKIHSETLSVRLHKSPFISLGRVFFFFLVIFFLFFPPCQQSYETEMSSEGCFISCSVNQTNGGFMHLLLVYWHFLKSVSVGVRINKDPSGTFSFMDEESKQSETSFSV